MAVINSSGDVYSTGWTDMGTSGTGSGAWTVDGFSSVSVNSGYYMRIGFMVFVVGSVLGTSNAASHQISNLPYTSYNNANVYSGISISYSENNSSVTGEVYGRVNPNSTNLDWLLNGNVNGWTASNNTYVRFSGWYRANSI